MYERVYTVYIKLKEEKDFLIIRNFIKGRLCYRSDTDRETHSACCYF